MARNINSQRWPTETGSRDKSGQTATHWNWRRSFSAFHSAGEEPSLGELLSDPVTRAVMRADGVAAIEVVAIFERLRAHIAAA